MKKKSNRSLDKVMMVVMIVWGLMAVGLLIYDFRVSGNAISTRTSASIDLTSTVSTNGTTYASSIQTTQSQGYSIKLNLPTYNGPLEVYSKGSAIKWMNRRTGQPFLAKNGVVTVTPEDMRLIPVNPGMYPARFRPHTGLAPNPYNWSSQSIVVVNSTTGTTPGLITEVSLDGITWSKNVSTTLDKGYYLRTSPGYIGWLEASAGKKWLQADSNGVVRVTPSIMKNGTADFGASKPGTYTTKFRPYTGTTNTFPWSNSVTITVTGTTQQTEFLQSSTIRSCSKSPKQGKEINIATYNLGRSWSPSPPQNKAVSEFVRANGVDILILQEIAITPTFNDVNEVRALLKTHQNRDWYYHFQPHNEDLPIESYGNMILSKYPIIESEKNLYVANTENNNRYFMRHKVKTPYGNLQVFNIHTRAEQEACAGIKQAAQFVIDEVGANTTEFVVVGGDFNGGYEIIEGKNGSAGCNLPSEDRIFTRSCITGASVCGYDKIDHLFRPKTSPYNFSELCRQPNYTYNGVAASLDHLPVLSTLKFN